MGWSLNRLRLTPLWMFDARHELRRHLLASCKRFIPGALALHPSQAVANPVEPLERGPGDPRSGVGDGRLRQQTAPEWNLAGELAGQAAPAKGTGHQRADLAALFREADGVVAGGGKLEGHADLVDRQHGRVGGEFAEQR